MQTVPALTACSSFRQPAWKTGSILLDAVRGVQRSDTLLFTVSGYVRQNEAGIPGVLIADTLTDSAGYFERQYPYNTSLVLHPQREAWNFSPSQYAIPRVNRDTCLYFNAWGTEIAFQAENFRLLPNYPNPFNGRTTLRFQLPQRGTVSISLHALNGKYLCTLVDEAFPKGEHAVIWNADGMASGMYFALMRINGGDPRTPASCCSVRRGGAVSPDENDRTLFRNGNGSECPEGIVDIDAEIIDRGIADNARQHIHLPQFLVIQERGGIRDHARLQLQGIDPRVRGIVDPGRIVERTIERVRIEDRIVTGGIIFPERVTNLVILKNVIMIIPCRPVMTPEDHTVGGTDITPAYAVRRIGEK
ncbi:MAG: T9SS type A sorting domain-containing protein [Candidatus Marinimicrobia bacterium]|nr:T9SS type A sorting domain-containing protein [Candidatus Neomarinimicrobiota bacterium]